ncbi:MAG: proteasome assembly chaperone family protein [Candidatus Lokiarchaeota archaeon]|nr:proteasome assembly chaperone family protein [Candidatus Lokiarchaeota archaeon]
MVKKEYICEKGKKSTLVVMDTSTEIKPGATMILGFAGIGLLGPIVANTLIDQISDIQEIGFITSEYLPPISVFYDGVLKHPFRLYYSPQSNIIVGIAEVPFQVSTAYNDLSKTINNWALSEDIRANEIVIFQGIPQRDIIDDYPVYYAAEKDLVERLESFGIKKVEKGIIVGPEATVLNEALSNRLKAYALFTPVLEIPTPEAGAAIIEILNKIYNLNIDTSKLIEEGKIIKKKMLELAEKAQQYQQAQQQLPDSGQPRKEYTQYYQ